MTQHSKFSLYSLGAPAILIMIACWQMYMAHTYHLTPWKGGGFGMFSTVDSQGARFVRVYLLTSTGEVPVEAGNDVQSLIRKVRAIPTLDRLTPLAEQLAQATWVPYTYDPFSFDTNQNQPVLDTQNDDTQFGSALQPGQLGSSKAVLGTATPGVSRPLFRALQPGEPKPLDRVIKVEGVRVELWRFVFNAESQQVIAHKFLESTAQTN